VPETTPPQELRILMLEDTPSDAQLMEHELRKEGIAFTVRRVTTSAAFDQALREFHPDIILSDYNLPAFTGLDALRMVRLDHPDLPVVMVTGALPDIEAVELIHAGANDYVLKDRLARLPSAIRRALAEAQEIRRHRQSQEQLRSITTTARDAILMLDDAGKIAFFNPAAETIFGYSANEALGQDLHTLLAPQRFGEEAQRGLSQFYQTGTGPVIGKTIELIARRRTGEEFPIELSLSAMEQAGRWQAVGIVRDITQRKQAEDALRRANRALKTLSAGNLALVRAVSEAQLLRAVTRVIVEEGGYALAVVDFAQDDPQKSLTPMAWSSMEEREYWTHDLSWGDNEGGQLPVARAIRTATTQTSPDIENDPSFAPWHQAALERGYLSNIALPLVSPQGTFGALSIYAQQTHAFDLADEVQLLEELASDLAYGILTLRTRIAHEQHGIQLRQSLEQSIQVVAATVEARDPYTAGHQRRVADLAAAIAQEMGLPEEQIHGIHLAASIHDLGKIHTPAEILSKPGKLTPLEFAIIKEHAQAGHDILKGVTFPWPIAQIVLQHHERLDGSGYPQGLTGGQILPEARILAVADVVEAMSSHRPYRPGLGIEAALEEIERHRGVLYDPIVVDACLALFRARGFSFPP